MNDDEKDGIAKTLGAERRGPVKAGAGYLGALGVAGEVAAENAPASLGEDFEHAFVHLHRAVQTIVAPGTDLGAAAIDLTIESVEGEEWPNPDHLRDDTGGRTVAWPRARLVPTLVLDCRETGHATPGEVAVLYGPALKAAGIGRVRVLNLDDAEDL